MMRSMIFPTLKAPIDAKDLYGSVACKMFGQRIFNATAAAILLASHIAVLAISCVLETGEILLSVKITKWL